MGLNKQNKKHVLLYKREEQLNQADASITWLGLILDKNSNLLNSKVSKLAPRRHKQMARQIIDNSMFQTDPDFIEELTEILEVEDNGLI